MCIDGSETDFRFFVKKKCEGVDIRGHSRIYMLHAAAPVPARLSFTPHWMRLVEGVV